MKLLIIDGLNFLMHRFPSVWSMSFDVIKKELDCLAFACKQADVMPLIVLDLYRSDNCGEQKWRRRRKREIARVTRLASAVQTALDRRAAHARATTSSSTNAPRRRVKL